MIQQHYISTGIIGSNGSNNQFIPHQKQTLREKCPYSKFLWSVFSPNAGKYGPGKLQIQTFFTH